jgi:peptidoglycan-N-acetylglucosamine deacetylase
MSTSKLVSQGIVAALWATLFVACGSNEKKPLVKEGADVAVVDTTAPKDKAGIVGTYDASKLNPLVKPVTYDSVGKQVDNGKKKIYLTFDDGPNIGTRVVLDILREAKVPATFYMIGLHRYGSPQQEQLWNEVNKEPTIEVTNHSYTHAYRNKFPKFYADVDGAVHDFVMNYDTLGFNNTIIRAPGSNVWRLKGIYVDPKFQQRTKIMDSLFALGHYITGWDGEWENYKQKARQSPQELVSIINNTLASGKTQVKNHFILLMHDLVYADEVDKASLKEFINLLKADPNVEFRVISQYPGAEDAFKIKPKSI